jgi:hypothetical protein
MNKNFTKLAFTPSVKAIQEKMGSRQSYRRMEESGDRFILTAQEKIFIETRVDFFISTVGENGWPYMQHRGGPKGFLKVLSDDTLGFADFKGNRQYISSGNIADNGKAMLFLIDYPSQQRVKIWAEAQYIPREQAGEYLDQLVPEGMENQVVSVFILKIQAYDWNCPKYITKRYTADEFMDFVLPNNPDIVEKIEQKLSGLKFESDENLEESTCEWYDCKDRKLLGF